MIKNFKRHKKFLEREGQNEEAAKLINIYLFLKRKKLIIIIIKLMINV